MEGIFKPAALGFFLEHGLDGWGTDHSACGFWIFLEHGLDGWGTDFGLRLLDFLEHGLDGWGTDFLACGFGDFWDTD